MPETGPHVSLAALCEKVITEGDGVMSIVRVVDRLTQAAMGTDPPEVMPPVMVDNLNIVLALKSDQAKGRFTLKLVIEAPDSTRTPLTEQDINLTPGGGGLNIVAPMRLMLGHEGLYWIDVIFGGPRGQEDQRLTRISLEVVYQRQRVPAPQSPPGA